MFVKFFPQCKFLSQCISVVLCLSSLGCGSLWYDTPSKSGSPDRAVWRSGGGAPLQSAAYQVAVLDEYNDGTQLHVLLSVKGVREWSPDDLVMSIATTSDGQEQDLKYFRLNGLALADLASTEHRRVAARESYEVGFSLPVRSAKNYQLGLFWGPEAEKLLASSQASLEQQPVRLDRVRVEIVRDCASNDNCQAHQLLVTNIINHDSKLLESVTLGIGYRRSPKRGELDLSQTILENEEVLELSDLALPGQQSRPLRVVFKGAIPEASASNQAIEPAIRVIKYAFRE